MSLTENERRHLNLLFSEWKKAREAKDYEWADYLRATLQLWQRDLQWLEDGKFHPHFETGVNKRVRAAVRHSLTGEITHPYTEADFS